jgi:hypothetical protein
MEEEGRIPLNSPVGRVTGGDSAIPLRERGDPVQSDESGEDPGENEDAA